MNIKRQRTPTYLDGNEALGGLGKIEVYLE